MSNVSDLRRAKAAKARPVDERINIYPFELERRRGWSPVTRWRRERDGLLPPRDYFEGGKPVGWLLSTIEADERRNAA
jgi:hypothetical protein